MLSGIEIFNFFVSDHLNIEDGNVTVYICLGKSFQLKYMIFIDDFYTWSAKIYFLAPFFNILIYNKPKRCFRITYTIFGALKHQTQEAFGALPPETPAGPFTVPADPQTYFGLLWLHCFQMASVTSESISFDIATCYFISR